MKTVSIFNPPLYDLGNKNSVSDIDGLKIFKFYEHMWYQPLTDSIKSFEERKDIEVKDTFDLSD
jgi:hypothetical protein